MPHYKDGTEAKIGDHVVGKLYNTAGVRAGTIVSITPGVDSCNAMVGYVEAVPMPADGKPKVPGMALRDTLADGEDAGKRVPIMRVAKTEAHGSAGAEFAFFECADYCAINELTKVGPDVAEGA